MPALLTAAAPALAAAAETRPTDPTRVVTFALRAAADPGILPRALELFAKRGLVPQVFAAHLLPDAETLAVEIAVAGMVRQESDHVANCLRVIPGVTHVLATERVTAVEAAG